MGGSVRASGNIYILKIAQFVLRCISYNSVLNDFVEELRFIPNFRQLNFNGSVKVMRQSLSMVALLLSFGGLMILISC